MGQYLKTSNNVISDLWADGTFCQHNQWTHECRECNATTTGTEDTMSQPLTPEQERTREWMRCRMHGCTASAVYGGLCLTHKDWEQDSCADCGQVFPLDELHAVLIGAGGDNLCEFCLEKHPKAEATADMIKLYVPELY